MMKKVLCAAMAAALVLSLLAACGNGGQAEDKQVDLAGFAQSVQEKHEFASLERVDPKDSEMGELFQNTLDNFYPGLAGMELEQMEVYLAMISFSGGELALVQTKDLADATKVKNILQARIDAKTTEGPGNYPEEVELWQRSAKVAENGNYLMLVCHSDADTIVNEFNALFQ